MEQISIIYFILGAVILLFFAGIKIVRPTHRGLIERLGKYSKFANPGFHWIIPFIDKMYIVNVTEQMVDIMLISIACSLRNSLIAAGSLCSSATLVKPLTSKKENAIEEDLNKP